MLCHKKCMYFTFGAFLLIGGSLACIAYFAMCEQFYRDKIYACDKRNDQVCDVCNQCNSTSACPESAVNDYCGINCASKENEINDKKCPSRALTIFFIIFFLLFGGATTFFILAYILSEAYEEMTGTQDDH